MRGATHHSRRRRARKAQVAELALKGRHHGSDTPSAQQAPSSQPTRDQNLSAKGSTPGT